MAKKKNKKNQKPVEWTSPPPSPIQAPEEAPRVPTESLLSPETTATETTQDDFQSTASSTQPEFEHSPPIETLSPRVSQDKQEDHAATTAGSREEEDQSLPAKEEGRTEPTPASKLPVEAEPPKAETASNSSEVIPEANVVPPPKAVEVLTAVESNTIKSIEEELPKAAEEAAVEPIDTEPKEALSEPAATSETPASKSDLPPTALEPAVVATVEESPTRAEPEPAPAFGRPLSAASPKGDLMDVALAPARKSDFKESDSGSKQSESPSPALEIPAPEQESSPPTPLPFAARTISTNPSSPPKDEATPLKSPPKPEAIKQVIEESRPPAPTPPIGRVRPRHTSAFEDDDDDDEALLIQTRRRGETFSRDSSRGLTYPPQPSQSRLFASRVPSEQYSNAPPPPPGYHPRYYPPGAPPYYHNQTSSMSQSGYPNQAPYGSPSQGSSPYQESWNQFPPTYHGSPPLQRHDSIGSREYLMGPPGPENNPAIEDDPIERLLRVSQVIPDIPIVLARVKELQNQIRVRDDLFRRADHEFQDRLRSKDDEITDLKKKVSGLENKHSGDANRLRLEVGNMEEQMRELREQIAETDKLRKEVDHRAAKQKDMEDAIAALEKTVVEEQEKAQKLFDEWKTTTTTKHDAEKIALAIQFDKQLKEADVRADNQRQEAAAAFIKEKDELRSEHQRQQREREASFDLVRKELETKLSIAQKDREEAQKQERKSREVWASERDTLLKAHIEDRDSIRKGFDEQRQLLEATHKKMKDESDKAWIELHAEANKRAEDEKARVGALAKERDELQKKYDDLMAKQHEQKTIAAGIKQSWENEKARMEKLMECYGDVAEIKSKGDTYYLVSFSQLQKQIVDLGLTHFNHLPISPPPEDLAQIPSGFPSFLGDTVASRQLRSAYIVHTVSKMVTYRVFGPFLFSLGRRYDKADSLFSSMSNHIREKSARKEAIWRQQTLLAAFTSTGAKARINTAAGTVVDEIVNAIKNFADPREEEGIKIAVRRIVKLAAETWRFARLEREMITATMPALHDEEHKFTSPDFWPAFKPDDTPVPSLILTAAELNEQPKLILRLFPVISREPKHESSNDDEKPDEGCIYHHGLALYDDAKPVVSRLEELKAAGLPPSINTSPTAADFPEPLIPPPRHPLPSPPPIPQAPEEIPQHPSPPAEPVDPLSFLEPTVPEESKSTYTRPIPVPIEPSSPSAVTAKNDDTGQKDAPDNDASPPPPPFKEAPTSSLPPEIQTPTSSSSPLPPPPPPPPEIQAPTSSSSSPPPPSPPHQPQRLAENEARDIALPTRSEEKANSTTTTEPSVPDIPPPPIALSRTLPSPSQRSETSIIPPQLPGPTESAIIPPFLPPLIPVVPPQPTPTEPAAIPPVPASTRTSSVKSSTRHESPPTPPRSRAATPTSPLFAAVDEIEGLQRHTSTRKPSLSRRSTRSKNSNEELEKSRPDNISRRTSGYTISNKSNDAASMKSSNSRYTCESRSAAIKALYPNGPLAGQPVLRSSKHRSIQSNRDDSGTWDTSATSLASGEANPEPSTHH